MPYFKPAKKDFERVTADEWINGSIVGEDVFRDVEQKFKDNKTGEAGVRKVDMVRFKFQLDGCVYNHYSRKMTLSMSEKSNLYKFLQQIYGQTIVPDIPVDTTKLAGLKVKTMWANDGEYQNLVMIRPLENPPSIWDIPEEHEHEEPVIEPEPSEEAPF